MVGLQCLQRVLEDLNNSIGILVALFNDVDKGLLLKLTRKPPNHNAHMPRNTSFAEPVGLRLPVSLWYHFIAQFWVISTVVSSTLSRSIVRALSC